ncbi:hypothetical protein PVAR5_2257 [Paecilomyces variotii No. 5]|uniref:Uncharacterized protein n=1 Tax=Byssochlamys spectabilis (strain No. 5 / NBRC 109023) TaxID=1356009 RepID=V5FAX1_BYSSN|nr:hypothetical protein PVAR5_2257 [Paecilomyces variotii No. 5]
MDNDTQPPPPANRHRRLASNPGDPARRGRSRSPDMSRIQYRSRSTDANQGNMRDGASRPDLEEAILEQELNLDWATEELHGARDFAMQAGIKLAEIDLLMIKGPRWRRAKREYEENQIPSGDRYQAKDELLTAFIKRSEYRLWWYSLEARRRILAGKGERESDFN